MKGRSGRLGKAAALGAATLLLASIPFRALSQEAKFGSVSLKPADTGTKDPNLGGWFVLQLGRGETGRLRARITNVDDVPQHVRLHLADLTFDRNGTAAVNDGVQKDVGAWGRFLVPDIVVGPKAEVEATFEVTAPPDAESGDHVGVVVAVSDPDPGNLTFVLRTATRLYVTIPGEAKKAFEIDDFNFDLDSWLFPKEASATIILKNTGRIRLQPKVSVRNTPAEGADVLLSQSREKYIADVKVPWHGGLIKMPIEARSEGGLIRRVNASKFVFPFALILVLVLTAGLAWLVRKWWTARGSRLAAVHADIRRLETLIVQRPATPAQSEVAEVASDEGLDEVQALLAALKRARRTQSQESLERLALALHQTGTNSPEYLLEALPKSDLQRGEEHLEAIRSYGPAGVDALKSAEIPPELIAASGKPPTAPPRPARTKKKPPSRSNPKKPERKTVPKSRVILSPSKKEMDEDEKHT